jgi:penicillin-insensitive murein endopeptidase
MRWFRRFALAGAAVGIAALVLPRAVVGLLDAGPSRCHGGVAEGWLENGVPLTGGGAARPYCWVCTRALRTYGHERAVAAVDAAYAELAQAYPGTDWVYGESGWPWGGRFRPHRTHRNGLAFDLMVPLADGARLPTGPWNRFGCDEAFDAEGVGAAGRIDFAAMADHLSILDRIARAQGGGIRRVIFAPDLQDNLFAAPGGAFLRQRLRFNARPSWVRHDDHYHVEFDFPCARV